jgi:ribosomal protein S18 acetylase RimI-like enzyme
VLEDEEPRVGTVTSGVDSLASPRVAAAAGLDATLAFWRTAAEDANRSDSRQGVQALLIRDPDALILAEDADQIVGSLIAVWDGWRCHIYRLAVRPDRRRPGIGSALPNAAELRFTAAGARRVDAMVLDDNEPGQHAWLAAGYERQPEWSRWVKFLPQPAPNVSR